MLLGGGTAPRSHVKDVPDTAGQHATLPAPAMPTHCTPCTYSWYGPAWNLFCTQNY